MCDEQIWSFGRRGSHFVQLVLHDRGLRLHGYQLEIENNGTYKGNRRQNNREYSDTACPSRHHSFVYLVLACQGISLLAPIARFAEYVGIVPIAVAELEIQSR